MEALRDPRLGFVPEAHRERAARAVDAWDELFWPLRAAVLHELLWEVRWDGKRRRFSLLLNEVSADVADEPLESPDGGGAPTGRERVPR